MIKFLNWNWNKKQISEISIIHGDYEYNFVCKIKNKNQFSISKQSQNNYCDNEYNYSCDEMEIRTNFLK